MVHQSAGSTVASTSFHVQSFCPNAMCQPPSAAKETSCVKMGSERRCVACAAGDGASQLWWEGPPSVIFVFTRPSYCEQIILATLQYCVQHHWTNKIRDIRDISAELELELWSSRLCMAVHFLWIIVVSSARLCLCCIVNCRIHTISLRVSQRLM